MANSLTSSSLNILPGLVVKDKMGVYIVLTVTGDHFWIHHDRFGMIKVEYSDIHKFEYYDDGVWKPLSDLICNSPSEG